ncbi:phenylalanine--tRNA ligase subunit beta [Candidatus Poriferisodalis sp.]|uniref:phenylalanine--tRNA ligase subunit beta n=1 Tax=Candidatus Poriferisodalis sp. TaxID=3101277 RepID=UPI003B016123
MKVLLSWLREFASIEGEPDELADHLSDLGMAVEEMRLLPRLDGVVVARVAGLRPHPDADRIQLVDVELPSADGAGADRASTGGALQVCCGAFNMAVGDLIPLATLGTTMPGGLEIGRRRMRGEVSEGMCCSAAELGLGADADGIMVLPSDMELGAPLMSQLGLAGDVLYDLEVNPNRPDAMSVAGVARDLAARLGAPFRIPQPTVVESGHDIGAVASAEIIDRELCGRFGVRVVSEVSVGESPLWMQARLALCGMRPINSVVDVSNYVMLELGTPNHTYDLGRVPAGHLATRRSTGGERLVTLDGVERDMQPGDGLIVDRDDRPIGIAGVMGGESTEISTETSAVLVELASWDRLSITRTSQRLGLRSEASMRFERGTDYELVPVALDRFCELLDAATPGGVSVRRGRLDVRGELAAPARVRVRPGRISHLLGRSFAAAELSGLLDPIGFGCAVAGTVAAERDAAGLDGVPSDALDVALDVTVPSFRPDVVTETDVAEEVARHYGYGRLGRTVPRSPAPGRLTPAQHLRRDLRRVVVGAGASEAMPNPFLAPDALRRAGMENAEPTKAEPIRLLNPLAAEESVLRPSLRPGLLAAAAYNGAHRNDAVCLFELGVVFARPPVDVPSDAPASVDAISAGAATGALPVETEQLGVIWADSGAAAAVQLWHLIETAYGLDGSLANARDLPGMHPARAARVLIAGQAVGVVGEIDPAVCDRHGLGQRCAWLELDVTQLLAAAAAAAHRPYRLVSTYPSSDIDLAFAVPDHVPASAVSDSLRATGSPQVRSVALFDVYRGDQMPPGTRSLAYRLRLQADDRTLTDDHVAEVRRRCIDAVEREHGAQLR